jgi:hypothetical protein
VALIGSLRIQRDPQLRDELTYFMVIRSIVDCIVAGQNEDCESERLTFF